jgi:DNA-binding SARP family transcriptional activator
VLLVHSNQVLSTDRLVELVWNGAPANAPVRALHLHLPQLRRALHPEGDRRRHDHLLAGRPATSSRFLPALDVDRVVHQTTKHWR